MSGHILGLDKRMLKAVVLQKVQHERDTQQISASFLIISHKWQLHGCKCKYQSVKQADYNVAVTNGQSNV